MAEHLATREKKPHNKPESMQKLLHLSTLMEFIIPKNYHKWNDNFFFSLHVYLYVNCDFCSMKRRC